MGQMNTIETEALFSLLGTAMFGKENKIDFSKLDFSALYEEAKNQRVDGVVFSALPCDLPEKCMPIYTDWYNRTMYTLSNNLKVSNAHIIIHKLMTENNIRYCVIKGCASALYYSSPEYRSMGDVDFLVEPKDVERAKKVLNDNGFIMSEKAETHAYHISFNKNKIHYELHYAVSEEKDGYGSSKGFAKEVLDEVVTVPLYKNLGDLVVTSEKHHCMIMLSHMKKHMIMYGMGLRHVSDWAVFINKYSNEEFVEKFKKEIVAAGFWSFAQAMGQISHIYLGADYKDWFGEIDRKNSSLLMEYVFDSGNFGRKRKGLDWMFIEPSKKKTGSAFLQLYRSYLYLVGEIFPKSKSNKLLFCLCFVYAPFRHVFRVLTGKKKRYNPIKVLVSGKQVVENSKIIDKFKE